MAYCDNPRVNLDFNWYMKSLPLDEFPKAPAVAFRIIGDVLSKERRKKRNKTRFTGLYLGEHNMGYLVESFFVSLPLITLGTLLSIF